MGHHKIGLIIPHPEDQKWDSVWKLFRTPNLNLPTLAALIPEDEWDIEIQDEIVGPSDFTRDYDLVFITVTTVVAVRAYEVARLFRERGAKVVLGGIHPSTLPDEAIKHADAVVIGGAGAYCAAMATINYNSYPQAPEVMLEPDGRRPFSDRAHNGPPGKLDLAG